MRRRTLRRAGARRGVGVAGAALLAVLGTSPVAWTQTTSKPVPPPAPPETQDGAAQDSHVAPSAAQAYFTDVTLVDQHGTKHRLYSDLMDGKIVVVNAFFTSCTGVCPVLMKTLGEIQRWLGDRQEKDVRILSISVDPLVDVPDVLAEYAAHWNARPGWYFLTGSKENVDWANYRFGQFVEERDSHTPVILVGNLRTGLWKKVMGLADPAEVLAVVKTVVEDAGPSNP